MSVVDISSPEAGRAVAASYTVAAVHMAAAVHTVAFRVHGGLLCARRPPVSARRCRRLFMGIESEGWMVEVG